MYYLMDALDTARGLVTAEKNLRETIDSSIDSIEFKDSTTKENLRMWADHYINGVCSYGTFENVVQLMGLNHLLTRVEGDLSINEKGEILVRNR